MASTRLAAASAAVALLILFSSCFSSAQPTGSPGACRIHSKCFNLTRTSQPANPVTGIGFLYYDQLCTLVNAGTAFCLDPGSGCRRCKTQFAADTNEDYPICPLCVCQEFPDAYGCQGQKLPPPPRTPPTPSIPPAPQQQDCSVNSECFASAQVNNQDGIGYQYFTPLCNDTVGTTKCVDTRGCRSCKSPYALDSVDLPICPGCVCSSYYTADACLDRSGRDYYGLGPFPFQAPIGAPGSPLAPGAPRPSVFTPPSLSPAPAPAPSPTSIPVGAIALCLRTASPNVNLGVTYQYFDFFCYDAESKATCTEHNGCRLCRLVDSDGTGVATRVGGRKLMQAPAPAPINITAQPFCPYYVCDYEPFNLDRSRCLPAPNNTAPAPGNNQDFVSVTAGFLLIGPSGTLIPFNETRQEDFINSVADALLVGVDDITINNYTEVANRTLDFVNLFFTVNGTFDNATLLEQQINALAGANSDFAIYLANNGLNVTSIQLVSAASQTPPSVEELQATYTICGQVGSLIPFNSTKQSQFIDGVATFINLAGDYAVEPANITIQDYIEKEGDPECVDVTFGVATFSDYSDEVAERLDSIGDPNGAADTEFLSILNSEGLGVSTISQSGSVIESPAPGPSPSNDDDGGLSGGAIAGIVVGAVVGALLLLLLLCLCCRRRRNKQKAAAGASGATFVPQPYKPPEFPAVDVEVLPSGGGTAASGPSRAPTAPPAAPLPTE